MGVYIFNDIVQQIDTDLQNNMVTVLTGAKDTHFVSRVVKTAMREDPAWFTEVLFKTDPDLALRVFAHLAEQLAEEADVQGELPEQQVTLAQQAIIRRIANILEHNKHHEI